MAEKERLTDNFQADGLADLGLGADLALVQSGVAQLNRSDAERPQIARRRLDDGESRVVRVRQLAERQNVQIPLPDPRYLEQEQQFKLELSIHFSLADRNFASEVILHFEVNDPLNREPAIVQVHGARVQVSTVCIDRE